MGKQIFFHKKQHTKSDSKIHNKKNVIKRELEERQKPPDYAVMARVWPQCVYAPRLFLVLFFNKSTIVGKNTVKTLSRMRTLRI